MANASDHAKMPQPAAKPTHGFVSRLRNYFLTGLIVAGPVAITLYLIWWFVTWVDNWVRPFIPVRYRPETYLPIDVPGFGLIIAFVALTLLGFLTANLVGSKLVGLGESLLNRGADRAADLSDREADFSNTVLKFRIELSQGRSGRVPGAGHVVAGVSDAIAQCRYFGAAAGHRARLGFHAVHAEPDDRVLFLRAAPRRGRSRHLGRSGDATSDFGRRHPTRRRAAQFALLACRNSPRRADRANVPALSARRSHAGEIAAKALSWPGANPGLLANLSSQRHPDLLLMALFQ